MDNLISNLKSFIRKKKKVHFLCRCNDQIIHNICHLIFNIFYGNLKIKNPKKTHKLLYPMRDILKKLCNRKVSTKVKRKILVDAGIRKILFPQIQDNFFPCLLRSMPKKNKKQIK